MLNRRNFLVSGLAAGMLGMSPAEAHRKVKGNTKRKVKRSVLPQRFMPREVSMWSKRVPLGEVHIYPDEFALYWPLSNRRAIRYSVGIGRGNLYHAGTFFVGAKKKWPEWTPTPDMIKRQPKQFARFANGMAGGIKNPLGARALYLYTKKRGDSFLRIHGTNNPRTIGVAVSNGCARLVNDQVIELYDRIPMGTVVVLHPKKGAGPEHA